MAVGKGSQSDTQQQALNFQSAADTGAVNFGATYIGGGTGSGTVAGGGGGGGKTAGTVSTGVSNAQTAATGGGFAFGAGSTTTLKVTTADQSTVNAAQATTAQALQNQNALALEAIQGLETVAATGGGGGGSGGGGYGGGSGLSSTDLLFAGALVAALAVAVWIAHR